MRMHAVTDTVSYFADPTTHDLLRALFGEQDARHWQDEALCAQVDGDMWFPEKGGTTREAKRICAACPVRADCLEYALARKESFGVWGGLSERERNRLTRAAA